MKTIHWLILSLILTLSAGFTVPVSASPASTICTGAFFNMTVPGTLIVPAGAYCELNNVTVRGKVHVRERSTFAVYGGRIDGSLTSSGYELVLIEGASVGGRIRLSGGVSARFEYATLENETRLIDNIDTRLLQTQVTGDLVVRGAREVALLCGATIEGNAWFADHRGELLIGDDPTAPAYCSANKVSGNLLVYHNRSDTIVANTTVGRNLICTANNPAPLVYGNQVRGKSLGQCGFGKSMNASEPGAGE